MLENKQAKVFFTSLLPVFRNVAPTIGKTVGLSTLAGLASEGASQILKKVTGGQIFRVSNQHLFRLAMFSELLNKGQIRDLGRAHKDGSDVLFKIRQKQVGNGIGTILASIGIPMILDAFKGEESVEVAHEWVQLAVLVQGSECRCIHLLM